MTMVDEASELGLQEAEPRSGSAVFCRWRGSCEREQKSTVVVKCLGSQFLSATNELFDLEKLFFLFMSSAIEWREDNIYFIDY